MDTRKRSVDGLDEGRNCVLQRNACSKHGRECPSSWIMVPQVHDFLHQFPGDLQQMIIAETVVPTARCIKQVFDHCYDPWTCQDGAHTYEFSPLLDFDSGMAPCTPSMCYTSRCELIRKEGYKVGSSSYKPAIFLSELVALGTCICVCPEIMALQLLRQPLAVQELIVLIRWVPGLLPE
jgi:hypothetical protein